MNFGIVPFTFENPDDFDRISAGDKLEMKGVCEAVEKGLPLEVRGPHGTFRVVATLSGREKEIVLRGGLLAGFGGK